MNTSSSETISSTHLERTQKRSNFYVAAAVFALFIVLTGFSLTYVVPMATGTFSGRVLVHIHGAMYFLWILLFILQPSLIHASNVRAHRKLGVFGFILAGGMLIMGVAVAITGARLNSPTLAVGGLQPKQFLIVPLSDMLLFATFLSFSLANLKKFETHKRLMVLATLALLPAAIGRIALMIGVFNLFIILLMGETILIAAIVNDLIKMKKIHPVYKWGGALTVIVHVVRFPIGGSAWWTSFADWLIG